MLNEGKEPIEVREVQLTQVYAAVKVTPSPWLVRTGKLPYVVRAEHPEQVAATEKMCGPGPAKPVGNRVVKLGKETKEVTAEQPVQAAAMVRVVEAVLREVNEVSPEKGLAERRCGQVVQVRDT